MRPHVEFIHTHEMPFETAELVSSRADIGSKLLSLAPGDGALSAVLSYPAGWKGKPNERMTADEEFFVLSGAILIGNVTYGEGCYAHLPAGYAKNITAGPAGAEVLTFFSQHPDPAPTAQTFDRSRLVERHSLYEDGWDADYSGVNSPEIAASGSRKKLLRTDPVSGDQTWIMGVIPSYREKKVESHPVVQECYIVSGELAGNYGLMTAGSYFWRPPQILHGPYGTKTGAVILSRTIGGKLIVDYYDLVDPFSYSPAHKVRVPEDLQVYAQERRPSHRY